MGHTLQAPHIQAFDHWTNGNILRANKTIGQYYRLRPCDNEFIITIYHLTFTMIMRVREFKYLENIFLPFLFLSNFPLKHLLYTCAVVTKEIYIRSFPTNQIADRLHDIQWIVVSLLPSLEYLETKRSASRTALKIMKKS